MAAHALPAGIDPRLMGAVFKMTARTDVVPLGLASIDGVLPGGLARAALHEAYAAGAADAAAATAFALALAHTLEPKRPIIWARQDFLDVETGRPYGPGCAELGLDPGRITLVRAHDGLDVLQAALEAARCSGLGAVVAELWGETKAFDLTASRRLALAAEASALPVLVVRCGASPGASAAETRWQVRPAPSRALAANAPGQPSFQITLLRQKSGPFGQNWHVEWNRDRGCFEDGTVRPALAERPDAGAPLSGTVVPLSFGRPVDTDGPRRGPDVRRAG